MQLLTTSFASSFIWCEHLAQQLGVEVLVDPEYCAEERIKGRYWHADRQIVLWNRNDVRTYAHELVHAIQCSFFRLITDDCEVVRYWCALWEYEPDEEFLSNWKRLWAALLEKGIYEPEDEELELFAFYVSLAQDGYELFQTIVDEMQI